MPLLESDIRDNPKFSEHMSMLFSAKHAGIRRSMFLTVSLYAVGLALITPFLGAFAASIISGRGVGQILVLRELSNLVGVICGILALFFLTGSTKLDFRRTSHVIASGLIVSLVIASVRLAVQPVVGLRVDDLGSRWFVLETMTSIIFTLFLVMLMVLVAERYTLVAAEVILRDEARRALEEDHESLRVRVFDHLHGTVQSELLVIRIRLLDIAREIDDAEVAASISKEAQNIGRIHDLEIRRLAHVMVASGIDVSLSEALRQLSLSVEGLCEVKIDIYEDFSEFDQSLLGDSRAAIRLAIFRIVEECVNNAIRHGNARQINILIGAEAHGNNSHTVFLQVSNDGILPNDEPRDGAGLRVMRARAAIYNGTVSTTIANGTFTINTSLNIRS